MNMIDSQQRILSPEQLAEWTPAHRRMYAKRLPKSWPRVREMLAMSERAMMPDRKGDPNPSSPPDEPMTDLQVPPIIISWHPDEPPRPRVAEIIDACSRFAKVSVTDIKSARRLRYICRTRQAVMYLATKHSGRSLPEIGRLLGGKDHSTIFHGRNRVQDDLDSGGSVFGPIIAHVERELGVA